MSDATIYESCAAEFDVSTQLTSLLQCISDGVTAEKDDVAAGLDTFFLIFAGALVYFMQTGFAMLCAGSIRAKNVKNVLLWNLLDSCGGGISYWAVGYAFSYGGDNPGKKTFIGNTNFFLMGDEVVLEFWFFQFAFACAVSSIVAGTIAERCKMTAYLWYSSFVVGFVYPVVAHAFWSTNGFLSNTATYPLWGSGVVDLAGSGPVHMLGGVSALAAALVLGPRMGRFYEDDGKTPLAEPKEFPPHSVALQFLGTFCLWFGWYGFNPGSTLKISSSNLGDVAARAAVNTTLSACAGAASAMFTSTIIDERRTGIATYDLGKTMNGCLTGLVAITAGCATLETWAAVVVGIFAGWFYLLGSHLLIKYRIDDAVDAIPVHMVGGAWGVIATGLFSAPDLLKLAFDMDEHVGWFYSWGRGSGDFTLLGIQIIAVMFIFGWTFTVMGTYFLILNRLGMFRIDPLEEMVGMDISRHKGAAYELDAADKEHVAELSKHRMSIGDSSSRRGKKADPANIVADEAGEDDVVMETAGDPVSDEA